MSPDIRAVPDKVDAGKERSEIALMSGLIHFALSCPQCLGLLVVEGAPSCPSPCCLHVLDFLLLDQQE